MIIPTSWGSDWFLSLPLSLRLAWQFLVQHADRGGFFDLDRHQHLLRLACEMPTGDILAGLQGRLVVLTPTLWQLRGFVPEQFPRDYAAKLNGVQAGVVKELRHRAQLA